MDDDAVRRRLWYYPESRCPVCNCSKKSNKDMLRFLLKSQGLEEHQVLEAMQKERAKFKSYGHFAKAALKQLTHKH